MAIRVRDVSKRYGRRWALARLSVDIPQGSAVLLTGENGAGKTTLLRILGTAMRPTYGTIDLFGAPVGDDLERVRPRLSLMTHASYLYEDLSAHENLRMVQRLTASADRAAREAALERVGLTPHAHRPVRTYSAGMKRRLCLARMILRQPDLILLDEPFGQLDPRGVTLMEDVIREQHRAGRTLIIATHDVDRGLALCDLHLELSAGRQMRAPQPIAA
ncbi:MAG: heme ABC exporter ATP-binding protein CcmA [Myxococcota bacterium]